MASDRAEYMRQYRARKKAEAEGRSVTNPPRDGPVQMALYPTDEDVAEQVVKKKRGLKTASIEANFTGTPSDISRAILNATRYIKATPCQNDDEFAERINMYFAECAENSIIPRWETLALALGITRKQAWTIATGQTHNTVRQKMLERAKDILSAVDAELVQTGKVNPVVYIFRAKNFYDMRDQQDVVVTPNQPLGEQYTTEQLTEKYSTLIELDDGE